MHLILLFALGWMSFTLANIENERTTASVLPYILKRQNQPEIPKGEHEIKHYTLLSAATSSSHKKNENSIDETEQSRTPDNIALAKTDFPHSWQHGPQYYSGHNGHDLWNDVYKYYYATIGAGGDARPPPHGYGGAAANPATNAPSTVLLLLHLGLLSYILLAMVGALARLLGPGAGFNAAPFPAAPFYPNNMGLGQYGYWRTANENLLDSY